MSHVPGKEPLPVAKSGGGNSHPRAARQAKQKEKDAPLFLQGVPGVASNEQAITNRKLKAYDDKGCRELMCAFIRQTFMDVDAKTDFRSKNKNAEWELYKASAIHFIRSPMFVSLCRTLRLPADKIQRRAFQ
jgi:hypothetical protein